MSGALSIGAFTRWLATGERGVSSEAIVARLTEDDLWPPSRGGNHPYDPGDFRRCELLLREVPQARPMLWRMQAESPEWAALVDAWDELVALAESEGVFTSSYWYAPLTYARMRQIIDGAREAS